MGGKLFFDASQARWFLEADDRLSVQISTSGAEKPRLRLYEVIWKERFVDKIAARHGVTTEEVEDVLFSQPFVRFAEKGRVTGENLYWLMGRLKRDVTWLCFSSESRELPRCQYQPEV